MNITSCDRLRLGVRHRGRQEADPQTNRQVKTGQHKERDRVSADRNKDNVRAERIVPR